MAFAPFPDRVPGLLFMPDVITPDEERGLLKALAAESGQPVPQVHPAHQFGWRFLSKHGAIVPLTRDDYLGPLPDWVASLWWTCLDRARLPAPMASVPSPDHVLVNTYAPGDGCMAHVDDLTFWNEWVVGVSLGSGATLQLRRSNNTSLDFWLPPRSIYVLTGDARYHFTHGISFATHDTVDGRVVPRTLRTSITLRTIHPRMLGQDLRRATAATPA